MKKFPQADHIPCIEGARWNGMPLINALTSYRPREKFLEFNFLFHVDLTANTLIDTGTNETFAPKMKPVVDCQTKENVPAPIAIVGIAVRLPGGVRSTEEFWQMLSGGQDGRCVVPESRYNEAGFYSESGAHSIGTRYGYFLQDDLEKVDTSFFDKDGLQPGRMDPQQKLLLQVVWDCLENAGQVRWRGMPIGCFVGTFGGDWEEIETKDTQNAHNFHLIGRGKFALANVVSYEFDFKGPR